MTHEPDSEKDPPVKPQVIDLDAEDVTPAASPEDDRRETQAPPPPPPPPPKAQRRRSMTPWIIAALLAGALGGGWLYRSTLSAYLPSNEMTELANRMAALETNEAAARQQIADIGSVAGTAKSGAEQLSATVTKTAELVTALDQRVAGIEDRIKQAEANLAAVQKDFGALRSSIASGASQGGSGGSADPAALAALAQRLDAVEKDIASLKTERSSGGDAETISALRQTLSDIQAKIAAGAPYAAELERIVRMVPSLGGNDVLRAYAEAGLPDAKGLAEELKQAIPSLPAPQANTPAADGSYWDSILNSLGSVVTICDAGETDWRGLATQAADLAQSGDLPGAIALIDQAQGALPPALNQWRDRAAGRLKLDAAVAELVKSVSLVIAAKGSGQ